MKIKNAAIASLFAILPLSAVTMLVSMASVVPTSNVFCAGTLGTGTTDEHCGDGSNCSWVSNKNYFSSTWAVGSGTMSKGNDQCGTRPGADSGCGVYNAIAPTE